jgi:hypothetical protein
MNENNRNQVEYYLKNGYVMSLAPLFFEGYLSNVEEFDPNKYSVEDMIERTLELCKDHYSTNSETKDWETGPNRSRSSLDIWRHIKYYYPTITIFDVMHALYNMGKNDMEDQNLGGLFCPDIRRRVFRLLRLESHGEYDRGFGWPSDEYGLKFNDWEDI